MATESAWKFKRGCTCSAEPFTVGPCGFHPSCSTRGVNSLYPVTIQMQPPNGEMVALATILVRDVAAGGFEVLDVSTGRDEVVFAAAQNGMIGVWRIRVTDPIPINSTTLNNGDWTQFAAIVPLGKADVGVRLKWTSGGRVEAEVSDLRPSSRHVTLFRQHTTQWKFELAK